MADAQTYLEPTQESGRAFFTRGIPGSIVMLNLLRFRAIADYSGTPGLAPASPISGEAAYRLYMAHTLPYLKASGGEVLFHGQGGNFLIGPGNERWDAAVLVRQSSVASFLQFASNQDYYFRGTKSTQCRTIVDPSSSRSSDLRSWAIQPPPTTTHNRGCLVKRRDLLKCALAAPFLAGCTPQRHVDQASADPLAAKLTRSRVRPGDPAWPTAATWEDLNQSVGGRLLKPHSPFAKCAETPLSTACSDALAQLKNPYFIGEQPALTQTSGWVDAWRSQPSAYAVAAQGVGDVVAAVRFAREHNLRLVIKGGGHSYQGTSSAPDSLLVWTRHMNDVGLHDAFVARGCEGQQMPQPAVTLGAGAMWSDAYHAVTTQAGRYVQGGGCATVGVAGLVQSGGFGSFSKNYGSVAAGLLEAEIVTADGQVRIANQCTHPDLFWGIKGGGGGSLGVITRLTLRTRDLPETFGGVFGNIKASSEEAYRVLIAKVVDLYQSTLFNRHWGEKIDFTEDSVEISMVFQGLSAEQAQAAWEPLIQWVDANKEYSFEDPLKVLALPARNFWDPEYFKQHAPGVLLTDDRPGTPAAHVVWAGDKEQVGWFVHGYKSAWLPATLLDRDRQSQLVDALFASTRHWDVGLHFNKGLAGAPNDEIEAARDTATNPDVLSAFALAIIASSGPPAYVGLPNADSDLAVAHAHASELEKAMNELLNVVPRVGSYVSESDYFLNDWQSAFWGDNYPKLAAVKQKYDPDGLFFVHHGVGSESWSEDGFTRLHS